MIDRNLENVVKDINGRIYTKWCLGYIRENRGQIMRNTDEGDKEISGSSDTVRMVGDVLADGTFSPEDYDPAKKEAVARYLIRVFVSFLYAAAEKYSYSGMYVIDVMNEKDAYVYLQWHPGKGHDFRTDDSYTGKTASEQFRKISYGASEHSAAREILSGGLNEDGQTAYEVWYDK